TAALGNGFAGIEISDASNNTVGGTSVEARNVIAASGDDGVLIRTIGVAPAQNNLVEGNYIGTDGSGALALGNKNVGVEIIDTSDNTVGGTATGAGNVIAGNAGSGVLVQSTGRASPTHNLVEGNFIGTDLTGTKALGNTIVGVEIRDASNNTVGGTTA